MKFVAHSRGMHYYVQLYDETQYKLRGPQLLKLRLEDEDAEARP